MTDQPLDGNLTFTGVEQSANYGLQVGFIKGLQGFTPAMDLNVESTPITARGESMHCH